MEEKRNKGLELRCPKLGGEVTFAYCLVEGGDLPCSRTIACWQQYFPVETHLRAKLTQEQWDSDIEAIRYYVGRQPFYREYWEEQKQIFRASYAAEIDRALAQ